MESFKKEHTLEKRQAMAESVRSKGQFPVYLTLGEKLPPIPKAKFSIGGQHNMNVMLSTIRNRVKLDDSQGLFLFAGAELLSAATPVATVYKNYADEDGFLYLTAMLESTYG